MGAIAQYALQVALLLAAVYLAYKWALAGCSFYRFNRLALLCGYAISFLSIPLWNWAVSSPPDTTAPLIMAAIEEEVASLSDNPAPSWPIFVAVIYFIGAGVATILTFWSAYRVWRCIKSGKKEVKTNYTLVVSERNLKTPFSWGRYVVIPCSICNDDAQLIIAHELAHIRHRHWVDLIIGQCVVIFNWFNPAAYLMLKELQDVHEFEADKDVISSGIDSRQYQFLLLRNVSGSLFPMFADSLNHGQLKTRMRLMLSPKTTPYRKFTALVFLPSAVAVILGINTSAMSVPLSYIGGASLFSTDYGEVVYSVKDNVHSIRYVQDNMPASISMDVGPGKPAPTIYLNRHRASRQELQKIKADEVVFVSSDIAENRFIVKTK